MTFKSGGDVNQANVGAQFNTSAQSEKGVANTGPAIVDSLGGTSHLDQAAAQAVFQSASQANLGFGGHGGSDNAEANTFIGTV